MVESSQGRTLDLWWISKDNRQPTLRRVLERERRWRVRFEQGQRSAWTSELAFLLEELGGELLLGRDNLGRGGELAIAFELRGDAVKHLARRRIERPDRLKHRRYGQVFGERSKAEPRSRTASVVIIIIIITSVSVPSPFTRRLIGYEQRRRTGG